MPRRRKVSLEERQEIMRERYRQLKRKQDRRCKIDPDRVMALAGMGFSIRHIAQEIGCSEDSLRTTHRKAVEDGRARGGTILQRVLWERAMAGDIAALRYFMYELNRIIIDPRPIKPPREPAPQSWRFRAGRATRTEQKQKEAEKRSREYDEYLRRWLR